jgi:hypothetical protein
LLPVLFRFENEKQAKHWQRVASATRPFTGRRDNSLASSQIWIAQIAGPASPVLPVGKLCVDGPDDITREAVTMFQPITPSDWEANRRLSACEPR